MDTQPNDERRRVSCELSEYCRASFSPGIFLLRLQPGHPSLLLLFRRQAEVKHRGCPPPVILLENIPPYQHLDEQVDPVHLPVSDRRDIQWAYGEPVP